MAIVGSKVYARIPFGYNGKFRDRGEVFSLIDAKNNDKLEGMRYFVPFTKECKEISCDKGCGRFFVSVSHLEAHYRKRNCEDDSATPTKLELAEMVGADPEKFIMTEEKDPNQRATDFSNQVAGR